MKILLLLSFATATAFLVSACEEADREHDHHHHDHGSVTSSSTTEETTVHRVSPENTTTIRTY